MEQGHRKRRRVSAPNLSVEILPEIPETELKIIKAYPCFGDLLDEMRQYGYKGAIDNRLHNHTHALSQTRNVE